MVSKLMRRSGIAVGLVVDLLSWKPDAVFQVGVGVHCEEIAVMHEEWPDAKFVGMEPHPDVVKEVKSRYPGDLYECAVGDSYGKRTLHGKKRHKDGSSLYPHVDQKKREEIVDFEVTVVTLDYLFPDPKSYGERILLWLDCEGAELIALQGGANFVGSVDVVNVEMTGVPMGVGWASPSEIHGWLTERGFRRQYIHTQRAFCGQYDGIYVRPRLFRADICCDPWQSEGPSA